MYPVDINDFRILSSRSLSEYFSPESGESLHFRIEEISRFSEDFERLLRGKRGLQGFSKAGSFRKWWGGESKRPPDPSCDADLHRRQADDGRVFGCILK